MAFPFWVGLSYIAGVARISYLFQIQILQTMQEYKQDAHLFDLGF